MSELYNGHIVITNMPAVKLIKTTDVDTVSVKLKYEQSANGMAEIYVHKKCLTYQGGYGMMATYNVLLIDNEYKLHYNVINDRTGGFEARVSDEWYSASDICELAEITKKAHAESLARRPKRTLMQKIKGLPADYPEYPRRPTGMVTESYLSQE